MWFNRKKKLLSEGVDSSTLSMGLQSNINLTSDDVIFLCIGTDKSAGDSLGPMVGKRLVELGYPHVIGTLQHPLHALNLKERTISLHSNRKIIAIDSALTTRDEPIGLIKLYKGGLKAGEGVGKNLGEYGDYSILGIVNTYKEGLEFLTLQNTRLHVIVGLADKIVNSISTSIPVKTN